MQITKSQKRLFILLGLVLVYAVYDISSNFDTYSGFYSDKKTEIQNNSQTAKIDSAKVIAEYTRKQYLEKWGRNPFYKKVEKKRVARIVKKQRKAKLILYAISIKDNNSVALINDKMVKIGDMIEGYTLKKIEKKKIILSDGTRNITLTLDAY